MFRKFSGTGSSEVILQISCQSSVEPVDPGSPLAASGGSLFSGDTAQIRFCPRLTRLCSRPVVCIAEWECFLARQDSFEQFSCSLPIASAYCDVSGGFVFLDSSVSASLLRRNVLGLLTGKM